VDGRGHLHHENDDGEGCHDLAEGTDEESDDDFYERILAANRKGKSYVGNDSDYIQWAKEVNGVGDCIVEAAWNGPGTIRLIIVDANGDPATEEMVQAVYDHIVSPDDPSKRLIATGSAQLTVAAATPSYIDFEASGLVLTDTSLDVVIDAFNTGVQDVYMQSKEDNVLRYNSLRRVLSNIAGVTDYESFRVNGGERNIVLSAAEYAVTGNINFAEEE
jgi:uncharacterized phage protein gp47/JayE